MLVSCPEIVSKAEEGSPGLHSQCRRAQDGHDPHLLMRQEETTAACGELQRRQGVLMLSLSPHRVVLHSSCIVARSYEGTHMVREHAVVVKAASKAYGQELAD